MQLQTGGAAASFEDRGVVPRAMSYMFRKVRTALRRKYFKFLIEPDLLSSIHIHSLDYQPYLSTVVMTEVMMMPLFASPTLRYIMKNRMISSP